MGSNVHKGLFSPSADVTVVAGALSAGLGTFGRWGQQTGVLAASGD